MFTARLFSGSRLGRHGVLGSSTLASCTISYVDCCSWPSDFYFCMLWRHLYIKVLLRLWRRNICRASIQNRVESQEALIHASSSVAPMKALRGLTKLLCCSTGRQKHNLRTVSPRASLNTRRQTDQMVKLIIDTDPGVGMVHFTALGWLVHSMECGVLGKHCVREEG